LNSVVINAPVKINLTLDVFPPRDDGYHNLDSVVAVMSYPFDELKVTALPGKRVVRLITKATDIPRDSSNLAVRAAEIFLERFIPGEEVTIWINLAKRLPVQAGLGGGSSDAAATLIALSQIYPDVASESALMDAAASIGSDVPLFVSVRESGNGIVRLQGRGEIVERISRFPEIFGILVKPAEGVSTASAYAALDAVPHRKSGASTMTLLTAIESMTEGAGLTSYLTNDFDSVIADIVPSIKSIFVYLKEAGALAQVLCGSGSCVFGLCRDYAHARELARALAGRFAWVKITSMPASQTKMPGENAA
jgi:4-diphosphocytidyl-2C-methyl-D-erythritol kinase